MPRQDKLIRTSHATIALRDSERDRLPILFLHTQSASKDVFAKQFDSSLADEFRLIALDLPGHGASSDAVFPGHTYSISGYADAAIEVLELLGIEKLVVVGWGVGGQIALQMTASFPSIAGVVLTGSVPRGGDADALLTGFWPHADFALASQPHLDNEEVARLAAMLACGAADASLEAAVRRCDPQSRELLMESLRGSACRPDRSLAAHVAKSLTVVNGACDPTLDHDDLHESADDVLRLSPTGEPRAWQGRTIPGIGHMPFAEVPDIFNQILKRYVRALDAERTEASITRGILQSA